MIKPGKRMVGLIGFMPRQAVHLYSPIGAVALGWPAPDEPSPSLARGRRPLDDVVHRGRW